MKEFNINNLLGINENESTTENEQNSQEPAPVIEKVSISEIKNEIKEEKLEDTLQALIDYVNLSDEEKQQVQNILFGGKNNGK